MAKPKAKSKTKRQKRIKRLVKLGYPKKPIARIPTVADVMSKNIIHVSPFDTLDKIAQVFLQKKITGAPVLEKNFFIGEISKTDILCLVNKDTLEELTEEDKKRLSAINVAAVMKKPICIKLNAPVTEAERLMAEHNISRLLVLDEKNNLVGIITKTDLVKGKSKEEIKRMVSTKVDDMLAILERRGRETFKALSEELQVPESLIENWCKVLEDHGLVEIEYPAIGNPSVKIKYKV